MGRRVPPRPPRRGQAPAGKAPPPPSVLPGRFPFVGLPLARNINRIYNKGCLERRAALRDSQGRDTGGELVGNSMSDEEQITKLYQEMYQRMVAYASAVLADRALAEEAVQDTFCIFCAKGEAVLGHENPKGWLMRTLQNVIRNMQRHRAVMNRLIMQSLQTEDLEGLLVYDQEDVDVLYGDWAARADFQLLKRVVLDGCTMLEAAEECGITVEACKKRVQRIRASLKRKLSNL